MTSPDTSTDSPARAEQSELPEQSSPAPKPRLTEKQAKRAGQSAIAMLIAVLVTMGVVLIINFLNPTSKPDTFERPVDVDSVATQATDAVDYTALSPQVPEGWRATYARLRSAGGDGVATWEAGYVTGAEQFVGFTQTDEANPTWIAQAVQAAPQAGTVVVNSTPWTLYEPQDGDKHLVAELADTTLVIRGSGELADLETMAAALTDAAGADAANAPDTADAAGATDTDTDTDTTQEAQDN